jgi:hypothetical protein
MLNAERPYKAFMYPFLPAFLYHSTSAICIALIVHKKQVQVVGEF